MGTRAWIATLVVALILGNGCGNADDTETVAVEIQQVLDGNRPAYVSAEAWKDTHEFYSRREHAPAWMMDEQAMRVEIAIHILDGATQHGLEAADYGRDATVKLLALRTSEDAPEIGSDERARWLADADVQITSSLLMFGRDVAVGRTKPERIDPRWKARRQAPDLVGTLSAATEGDLGPWLDSIKPRHAQYTALQNALVDPAMAEHTGQIALNLERWRWMPDDLGNRHLIVNIPSYHLAAREGGQTVLDMKVVVGKPDHKTPIFSEVMTTTVFSPYWNVPDSIVEGETAPAAARDPGFLTRNNIEILRLSKSGATPVDPSTVD